MDRTNQRARRRPARIRTLLLAALAAASVTVSACKADQQAELPAQLGELPVTGEGAPAIDNAVDALVLEYLVDNKLPGATLSVTRGSRLVWSKGYGYADLDEQTRMEPWQRSKIGSVSKVITTISVMRLAEEGKLDLDQPIYGDPGPFKDLNTQWPPADMGQWVNPFAVLRDPGMYWAAMRDGVVELNHANHVHAEMNKIREWASQITVRHLLSHTAGFLRSGDREDVEAYYGREMRDYRGVHIAVLKGMIKDDDGNRLAPLKFEPGTAESYSNHGFGLLGHIVEEASDGPKYNGYWDYTKQHVLDKLGLYDVVPNNTHLDDGLDAWPHGGQLDPNKPAHFQATGGWSASARDLARIMCGIDQTSNNLRLLEPDTVTEMQSIPFPDAHPNRPHGWDWRTGGNERYKNGRLAGGTSVVMKYLPGRFDDAPDDEINVAIAINASATDAALGALTGLLRDIAAEVAAADVADDYDLFDAEYRCVGEGPTLTISDPNDGTSFSLGTEILFEAEARDANGEPLPVIWEFPDGDVETQPGVGGRHAVFDDSLPTGTHTIVATTTDAGGQQAQDEVTVEITYEAPDVEIVSPDNNETVWAGESLELNGQSQVGLSTLPDDQVSWEVIRGGAVIHTGDGHNLTVPGSLMVPGNYQITFRGHDNVESDSHSIGITAEPKPDYHPTATIIAPESGAVYPAPAGVAPEVTFTGSAVDGDGTPIDGTYFRWTVSSGGDEDVLLCAGANSPGEPGTEQDCSTFTAEFDGHAYVGNKNYTVTLEVWDADGNSDTASALVSIYVPPVS